MRARRSRVASWSVALGATLVLCTQVRAQDAAQALQSELRAIAEQASAGVVAIQAPGGGGSENPWDGQARASGFIFSADGHVLTDARFVRNRRRVDVRLRGGLRASARVLGVDSLNGIAVLQLEDAAQVAERMGGRLPALALGRSADLRIGQSVFTISNAFDSLAVDGAPSFSWGMVTSIGRAREGDYRGVAIETDAAVNPGAFGGPLLDRAGRVVGVCSVPFSTAHWLGMAVPIDQARLGAEDIIARRSLTQGFLGLAVRSTGGEAQPSGLEVARVVDGSPAAKAGVQPGDRVMALDGARVYEADDLGRELEPLAPGSQVTLRLRRGEAVREVRVVLDRGETPVVARAEPTPERRPTTPRTRPQPQPQPEGPRATLGVRTSNRQGGGVQVVDVTPGGSAARAGVVAGDVLVAVGGRRVSTLLDLRRVLDARRPGERVVLSVQRDGKAIELAAVLDGVGQPPATTPPTPTSGFLGVYLDAAAAQSKAQVDRCAPGSPAEKAGLRQGDVILSVNGQPIGSAEQLVSALRGHAAGDRMALLVLRGDQRLVVTTVLAAGPTTAAPAPAPRATPTPAPNPGPRGWLGAALVVREGRVVIDEVDPRGPFARAGLRKGDVVVEAGGRPLTSLEDFEAVFIPLVAGDRLPLRVERDGWEKDLEVRLAPRP